MNGLVVQFAPMVLVQKEFDAGTTIRVTFTLSYVVAEDTAITVRASPYAYTFGVLDRVNGSIGQNVYDIMATTTPETLEGYVDFTLEDINAGTYGLIVEILGTDYFVAADNVIVVKSSTSGVVESMMGMVMMVMMMGMIMPMVTGEEETVEEVL